jgi:MFS family permease
MFRKLIGFMFGRRHYWRSVSFDEIAELYTSRLLTVFAINIVNLFAAVYLYKLGYSLSFIALFYGVFYVVRIPFAVVMAKFVAFFGPKHGVLLSSLLRILSLVAFAFVPFAGEYTLLAIAGFGFFQQLSASAYDISYTTDFSKVKHSAHAGKEIGTMQMIEKAARVVSPLAGGVVASIWSPQITIILAALLFLASVIPLFATVEPTATRNRLRVSGFPWRLALPSFAAQTVVGLDFVVSGMVWTLFVTVFIFTGLHESIYLAIGGLASLGVLASIVAAWAFGQLVDKHKGGILLTLGAFTNTITHLFRPFISTAPGVMGVSIVNETATSAYVMPLTRVLFDVADSSGFRITYLMFAEMCVALGAALGSLLLWLALQLFAPKDAFFAVFIFGAVYELVLLVCRRAAR